MNNLKPSKINGTRAIMGGIFGIFIIFTPSMGAPWYLALFGIALVILALFIAIWNFKNVAEGNEEPDPINQRFGNTHIPSQPYTANTASFARTAGYGSREISNSATHAAKSSLD